MSSMVQDAYDMGITSTLGGLPSWLEDDNDDFYDDVQDYDFDDDYDQEADNDKYIKPNLAKVRIHEVAKELGITSKEVLSAAKEMEIKVKSAQSTITMEKAESLANYIMNGETHAVEESDNNQSVSSSADVSIINTLEDVEIKDLDMNINIEIQKRLEIILLSIHLDDIESIKLQTKKLLDISIYIELDSLLYKLSNEVVANNTLFDNKNSYISIIENYLNLQFNNKTYNKQTVINIYTKLDVLENEFESLEKEKATYIDIIHKFNAQYSLELGNIIKEILYLKKEIAFKNNKDTANIDNEEYNQYLNLLSELIKEKKGLRILRKKNKSKINNVQALQQRIKTIKKKIKNTRNNILLIKSSDAYLTIKSIESIESYFINLKKQLELEKATLQKLFDTSLETKKTESIEIWIDQLWQWADKNNISSDQLSRKKENLISTKTIDFTGLRLDNIPDEICNLKDIITLVLWDNNLVYLPENIINFKHLKKLNLRGNPNLSVTIAQKKWIDKLKLYNSVYIDNLNIITEEEYKNLTESKNSNNISINKNTLIELIIKWIVKEFKSSYKKDLTQFPKSYLRIKDESKRVAAELLNKDSTNINLAFLLGNNHFVKENVTLDMFIRTTSSIKTSKSNSGYKPNEESRVIRSKPLENKNDKIVIENSSYSKILHDIAVPTFERIRRVSMNYIDEEENNDSANFTMYEYMDKYGKRDKALLYSSFEMILEKFIGKSINIIDWGSEQSIASTILLDYIREKQLDIKIEDITLISEDKNKLSRGILHCNILKNGQEKIIGINKKLESISYHELNMNSISIVVNLIYNVDLLNLNLSIDSPNNSYFIALNATENDSKVSKSMQNYKEKYSLKVISNRNDKIGRFQRSEAIFLVSNKELN